MSDTAGQVRKVRAVFFVLLASASASASASRPRWRAGAAVARLGDGTRVLPGVANCSVHFFQQNVDHFDLQGNATFLQRYYVNDKNGGNQTARYFSTRATRRTSRST